MIVPETEVIISVEGAERGRVVLRSGEYVIGREPGVDVLVEANLVSRKHARLTLHDDHALIEDLGSSNGTFVNGTPVTGSVRLWPGQKIQVGSATITLHRQRAPLDADVSLTPQVAAVRRLLPEEVLRGHKYDIGRQIAQGGMGAILTAREAAIRREIAMKVMLGSGDEADLMRFVEEAQITGQLEHPNIVPVHELGVDENDRLFYTMKMVKGITLKMVLDLLAAGTPETIAKYPLAALLTIFQKVCDAVAFAHSKGVIHRDLKPENLMLGGYGEVLVMDWGLAKVVGGASHGRAADSPGAPAKSVVLSVRHEKGVSGSTLDGTIMGTPQYMAPEQARGEIESLDARTDIYALGAILYHILALRPSVTGKDAMEVVRKVGRGEIEPVERAAPRAFPEKLPAKTGQSARGATRSTIPDSLAAVVRKAMALRPDDRYATVPELQAEIAAYQAGFATAAEHASLLRQAVLLVKRHKGIFATAFAAWAIITALAGWFVINIARERNRAERGELAAGQERDRTKDALGVAEANLLRVKIQKAREAFDAGRGNEGLAWLAAVLRQDPNNSFAPAWLLSALTDRNFPIPAGPRITLPKTRTNPYSEQTVSARFSPDGQLLLTGNRAHGLALWHPFTGQPAGPVLSTGDIKDALWFPDGRRIAAMFNGAKDVSIYDATSGKLLGKTTATPHLENLARIGMSPDGSLLATGDGKGGVCVWNARTFEQVATIPAFTVSIETLDFSADNRWLAMRTTSPRDALVWDLRAGKAAMPVLPDINGTLRFHPSAPLLLVPAFTKMSRWGVLDLVQSRQITAQEFHGSNNIEAMFSPDGSRIASIGTDARARLWDAPTGAPLTPWMRHHGSAISAPPQFSPEGLRLFHASSDFLCRLWDARTGDPLAEPWGLPEGALEMKQCRLSPDGAHAVLASRRRTVQAWDIREGRRLPMSVKDGPASIFSVAFSPDGQLMLAAVGNTKGFGDHVAIWNAQTGEKAVPDLPHAGTLRMALSPDGGKLLTVSDDRTAMIWEVRTGKPMVGPLPHDKQVTAGAFSPDGRTVATAGTDRTLRLWDAATGQPLGAPIPLNHAVIQRVIFSPDGARLAAATDGGTLLHEIRSGKAPPKIATDQSNPDVSFSPDSAQAAIATENDGVRVVEAATGREVFAPLPHPNRVQTVRYSPDGARLLSAGFDGTARLWDARTGAPLAPPLRHGSPLNGAEFCPDGGRVATAGRDGTVRLWDTTTGQPLSEPLRHPAEAKVAIFTPDGNRLAVVNGDKIAFWEVPPAPLPAPRWLPALAEAVAGRRIDEQGEFANAGASDFWPIRDRLLARSGSADHYERWAAWFLADRATRTASPWQEAKLPDAVKKLLTFGDDSGSETALRYQPDSLPAIVSYPRSMLARSTATAAQRRDAEYLLALAPLQVLTDELARLRVAGHPAYTRDAGWRGFPARDPAATARQLDLTPHFNIPLDSALAGSDTRNIGGMPRGLTTLDGVRWDVRGVIALAKRALPGNRPYPLRVERIPVGQRAARLHFLQACVWKAPDGARLGSHVLRYADGATRELPIVYGEDVRDWNFSSEKIEEAKHARKAWQGQSEGTTFRVFHRAYENPRPDAEIASLDFVSTESESAPFVVAITVE
jgi:WD40 repeat protein/serine/threonine protein kinase